MSVKKYKYTSTKKLQNCVKQIQKYQHEDWRIVLIKYRYAIMKLEEFGETNTDISSWNLNNLVKQIRIHYNEAWRIVLINTYIPSRSLKNLVKQKQIYHREAWIIWWNKNRYTIMKFEELGETNTDIPSWSLNNLVKHIQIYHHEVWRTWWNKYRYTTMKLEKLCETNTDIPLWSLKNCVKKYKYTILQVIMSVQLQRPTRNQNVVDIMFRQRMTMSLIRLCWCDKVTSSTTETY